MGQPHKHAEIIKAWADGTDIQGWNKYIGKWVDLSSPSFDINEIYRIKPKTIKYRVALLKGLLYSKDKYLMIYYSNMTMPDNQEFFVKWLTDWMEVEV